MDVLLLTNDDGFRAALPSLELVVDELRWAPLTGADDVNELADVAIIDARTDPAGARAACRRLAGAQPAMALVAVASQADLIAVDLDWRFDEVVAAGASPAELHTRLRLAVGRRHTSDQDELAIGDLVLHPASYTASLGDRPLDLTLTEFRLLSYLVAHTGRAFTRTELMHAVWGNECGGRTRTVDVHIQRLRAKLGRKHESLVDTVRGVGYMAAGPPTHPDGTHWRSAVGAA